MPTPPQMNNHGNFIIDKLGAMCAWLAPQAEALGVEIYPGFAASEILFDEAGAVAGVRIGDMGIAKDGHHKDSYTQGIDIKAKLTVLGEGARGHLTKQLVRKFHLDLESDPQSYSIGIKELWQKSNPVLRNPEKSFIPLAGQPTAKPMAAVFYTISIKTASRSAMCRGSIIRTRTTSRMKHSSNGKTIHR